MAVVLFSAGLDSMIHLVWAREKFADVKAIYVNFGHRYAGIEIEAAHLICGEMHIPFFVTDVALGWAEHDDGYIPLRNLMLLEIASLFGDDIVFGMLYHEGPPDKRPGFVRRMQSLLNSQYRDKKYFEHNRQIKIHTPFSGSTKTQMLRWFLEKHSRHIMLVRHTIGCFSAEGDCGRCMSCFNRWVAFTNCGLHGSWKYSPPRWAAEQLIAGKKERQSLFALGAVAYKWKFILEIYSAMREIMSSPIRTAYRVRQTKSIDTFNDSLYCNGGF